LPLWFSLYVANSSDLSIFDSNWQHREKTKGAIKNGQTRANGNIERKPKGQSKMDKPEQLAT
jgi:hypothetical protein